MGSESKPFAEAIVSDKDFLATYRRWNPDAASINNAVFHFSALAEGRQCSECAKETAIMPERVNVAIEGLQYDAGAYLLWCVACDRLYHIYCSGEQDANLADARAPWVCKQCKATPTNAAASQFAASKGIDVPFAQRLEKLKRMANVTLTDDEDEDPLNNTIHLDRNLNPVETQLRAQFEQQRKESEKLAAALLSADRARKELEQLLAQSKREREADIKTLQQRLDQLQSSSSKQAPPVPSAPPFSIPPPCSSTTFSSYPPSRKQSFAAKILRAEDVFKQMQSAESAPFSRAFLTEEDMAQLTPTEKMAREQSWRHDLIEIRKSLPKIEAFDGDPNKWLTFQRAFERNRREGHYSAEMSKHHLRQALTGLALQRVERLFDTSSADDIMEFLRDAFGNSVIVVETARRKVQAIKLPKQLTHASVIEATTIIASYIQACAYAKVQFHDAALSAHIHQQLEPYQQQGYYTFFMGRYPDDTRAERLDAQFEFLEALAKTLPIGTFNSSQDKEKGSNQKSSNFQLMTIADSSTTADPAEDDGSQPGSSKEDYMFEVRSKVTAPYIGYDLEKVKALPKNCVFCDRNDHYPLECRTYRQMQLDERSHIVKTKGLCINCLLAADHTAKDCTLKLSCGKAVDQSARCSAKHHISLHRGNSSPRRQHYRGRPSHNQRRAPNSQSPHDDTSPAIPPTSAIQPSESAGNGSSSSQHSGPAAIGTMSLATLDRDGFQVLTTNTSDAQSDRGSSRRTIKLFRSYVVGPKAQAIAFAVGDSAAEVTLIKRSLADALGLRGEPCIVDVQWTDRQVKSTHAIRLQLTMRSILPDAEDLVIPECYAIDDFQLPPRSLDVDALKRRFPYLRNVPFASYHNAVPAILIGTNNAHIMEAIEPIKEGGGNNPVGLRAKLGYSIFGGSLDAREQVPSAGTIAEADAEATENSPDQELSRLHAPLCAPEASSIKPTIEHATERKALRDSNRLAHKEPLQINVVDNKPPPHSRDDRNLHQQGKKMANDSQRFVRRHLPEHPKRRRRSSRRRRTLLRSSKSNRHLGRNHPPTWKDSPTSSSATSQ